MPPKKTTPKEPAGTKETGLVIRRLSDITIATPIAKGNIICILRYLLILTIRLRTTVVAAKKAGPNSTARPIMSACQKDQDVDIPAMTPLLLVTGNIIRISSLVDKKKLYPWGGTNFIHMFDKWPFEFIKDTFDSHNNCAVFSVTDGDHTHDLCSEKSREEASYGVLKNLVPLEFGTALSCARGKDYYLFRSNFEMVDHRHRSKCMNWYNIGPDEMIQDLAHTGIV